MAKKYLGKNPLNTLMGIVLDVIPSKELSEDDTKSLWDSIGGPIIEVAPDGALSNWNYTLNENTKTITLNKYTGSETDVIVYGKYKINGKEYDTKIRSNTNQSYDFMFCGDRNNNCRNIKTITFKEGIDTSECTDMSYMFMTCMALTTINGLENLDTSNVTKMYAMFQGCWKLTSLCLSSFNTAKVTDMWAMFNNCYALTELDLRSFDTSNVTTMAIMFDSCSKLTEIKVTTGKWIIQSGCNTGNMFGSCGVSSVTYYPAA